MNSRDRRALLWGGLVILVAVFALRLVPWGAQAVAIWRGDLAARMERLAMAQAEIANPDGLEDSVRRAASAVVALAPRILAGSTEPEALSDLSGRLNLAASRHRVRVNRINPVPDSGRAGGLRRVSVMLSADCDSRGLIELLQALGRDTTVVETAALRLTASDPLSPGNAPEVLHAELTLAAWYAPRPADAPVRVEGER